MATEPEKLVEVAAGQLTEGPTDQAAIRRYMGPEWSPRVNWCAGFVAWCMMTAGYAAPAAGSPRRGARALVKWMAGDSGWVIAPPARNPDLSVLRPGDVVCWKRVGLGWQCHVAIIQAVDVPGIMSPYIVTISGNDRGQVRREYLSPGGFVRHLHGLYGVVRPQKAVTP